MLTKSVNNLNTAVISLGAATEKHIKHLFLTQSEANNAFLVDLADKCGFYYPELEEVLHNLAGDLMLKALRDNAPILPASQVGDWLKSTLTNTSKMAHKYPFPIKTATEGYHIMNSPSTAAQQYLNIREQGPVGIDSDEATLGFTGRILTEANLNNNEFQPNVISVVPMGGYKDELFRCQNPFTATLDTNAAEAYLQLVKGPHQQSASQGIFNRMRNGRK